MNEEEHKSSEQQVDEGFPKVCLIVKAEPIPPSALAFLTTFSAWWWYIAALFPSSLCPLF